MGRKAALKRRRRVEGRARVVGWAPRSQEAAELDGDPDPPVIDAKPALEALERRLTPRAALVIETPAGKPRISDSLDDVARPLLEELHGDDDEEAFVVAYDTAWAVWNLALEPEAEQAKLLREVRRSLEHAVRRRVVPQSFLILLEEVTELRRTRFAHDRRRILDIEVQAAPGGVRLAVAFRAL